jgi:lysophospholipid acyltransferase (LPLAT)-like uncharacterized protein
VTPAQVRKAALIAATAAPLMRALGATYRWRVDGLHHYDAIVAAGQQPIMAFWHGRILPATLFFRNRGIVVMISQNFDGEWITRVIERFGYDTARGSTSRGGSRALVQLRRELTAGKPVGFTLDGPRGPARVAQAGAIFLAGATGYPILPFHFEASSAWTLNSWDRTQIPKPFATVALTVGEPMRVADTTESAVESSRGLLETSLKDLESRARQLLEGLRVERGSRSR